MKNELDKAREEINEVDRLMAQLFERRLKAVDKVYEYKCKHGLPILDAERERAVVEQNSQNIQDDSVKGYYIDFLKSVMATCRDYQYFKQTEPIQYKVMNPCI